MKFLNLTVTPPCEQECGFEEIENLIFQKTGRNFCVVSRPLFGKNAAFFTLVLWPDPIGFGLIANKFIPKDTFLFYYGGALCQDLASCKGKYVMSANENGFFDASLSGDLGSLLNHAPDSDTLKELEISENTVQTNNVNYMFESGRHHNLCYANRDIKEGEQILSDYGSEYWIMARNSPSLFHRGSTVVYDLSQVEFSARAIIHPANKKENFFLPSIGFAMCVEYPLLLLCKLLCALNDFSENPQNPSVKKAYLELTHNSDVSCLIS